MAHGLRTCQARRKRSLSKGGSCDAPTEPSGRSPGDASAAPSCENRYIHVEFVTGRRKHGLDTRHFSCPKLGSLVSEPGPFQLLADFVDKRWDTQQPAVCRLLERAFWSRLEPLLHIASVGQRPASAEEEMKMIRHEHKRDQLPSPTDDRVFELLQQLLAASLISKDGLPRIATRHGMIDCAGIFNAKRASHAGG